MQGPVEKAIIEQSYKQRKPLPEKIANAPEIALGLEIYYVAFLDLSTCRPFGMGEGPIPWTAIDRYCVVNGIKGELREDLFFIVQELDGVYLKWKEKQYDK